MPGLLSNPLTHIGLGLLGQGQSRNPGDVGIGRGLQQGLLTYGQQQDYELAQQQAQQEQSYRQQQMALQSSRLNIEQERHRAEQIEAARQQELARLAAAGDPVALKELYGSEYAKSVFREPPKEEASIERYEYAKAGGYTGTYEEFQVMMKNAGAMKIQMPGTKSSRPLTIEEAAKYGIAPEDVPGYIVTFDGEVKARPVSSGEKASEGMNEKKRQAVEQGTGLLDNYRAKFTQYQEGGALPGFGGNRAQAAEARKALVAWYAKNILGTPGAEPSPVLYKQAEDAIPDFAGPYDRATFKAKMDGIAGTMSMSLATDGKKRLKYNPATGKLE